MSEATAERTLETVPQFCNKRPAFKPGGIRWQIFNSDQNGLANSGAIVRIGRKILIDPAKYFAWVDSQQRVTPQGAPASTQTTTA